MSQIVWYPPLPSDSGGADPANLEWGEIVGTLGNQTDLQSALNAKVDDAQLGVANGVATLGADGKLTNTQIPSVLTGAVSYQGSWNATTNTPTIPAAASGNKGFYYVVSVAGSTAVNTITDWKQGDWIISNGTTWEKVDNTDSVISVAGKTGAVTLVKGDVGLGNVDNTSDANKPVSTATQTALDDKVDKVTGKGLSTEDYTTSEKTKLSGIEANANNYTHPSGDGNLHVPATGTTNDGKVLAAGATAGSLSWIAIPSAPVTSVATKTGAVTLAIGDITSLQTSLDAKAPLASPSFTGTVTLPSTTSVGNVSSTELGYLDGVTSAIQTQLGGKQATISGAATSIVSSNLTVSKALVSDASGKVSASTATATEVSYLVGVTQAIQTQLNGKQATITGGATTIATSNLTANYALISDGSGKVAVATTTSTEIGYVNGVTSAIQTQLNAKHKLFNFTTGTSLTIDGATYNFHTLSVSANSSFSLSNLTTGLLYEFLVKNTAGASITITLPNTADVRVADTITIASGKAREFSLLYDGTKRYWQVSEELTGA